MSEQVSKQCNSEPEATEVDVSQMTPTERKRYKARLRKRRQREHERKGIPSGIETRLLAEWKANLAATAADPFAAEALRNRLFDFTYLRSQMQAAIGRLRRGVHPEAAPEAGRFPDCIGQDILDHIRLYGDPAPYSPMEFVFMRYENSETAKVNAIDTLRVNPQFTYRMQYGLDIDSLWNVEVEEYFATFAEFYLMHRRDPRYDFDWEISDGLLLMSDSGFQIRKKYLEGVFGSSTASVWVCLENFRNSGAIVLPPSSASETNPEAQIYEREVEKENL